jgi:histidinol-phosphate/aromatic aminotransferase/cobyric acid decarboxylase-like protein
VPRVLAGGIRISVRDREDDDLLVGALTRVLD